jgi:UDP-N-acetylmuramate dehydrogenase
LSQPAGERLRQAFGDRLKLNEPLARYTSARIGGPADYVVAAESGADLAEAARLAYSLGTPFLVLGGGSNILVADSGVRGLVILNRAKAVEFRDDASQGYVTVIAESGCSLGALARQCVQAGYAGLEWAATVPGTVGGAVYGNAGAHGGDIAARLKLAVILHRDGSTENYTAAELGFGYRMSALKQGTGVRGVGVRGQGRFAPIAPRAIGQIGVRGDAVRTHLERDDEPTASREDAAVGGQPSAVVLSAEFGLTRGDPAQLQATVDQFVAHRKRTQPPGASLGSMFKNPAGDFAGRLIEACGLKGARAGEAEVSSVHANFFVNLGEARAADVKQLLDLAQSTVRERFGVELETEIELVGDWRSETGNW